MFNIKQSVAERVREMPEAFLGCSENRLACVKICDIIINFIMFYFMKSGADKIVVKLNGDYSMEVEGNGFCPPLMSPNAQGTPLWERLFCHLFDEKLYDKMLGNIHNPSGAQFFCEYMDVVAVYQGNKHLIQFNKGNVKKVFTSKVDTSKKSFSIIWKPDCDIFEDITTDPQEIKKLLQRYAAAVLNKCIIFKNANENEEIIYYHTLTDRFRHELQNKFGTDCKIFAFKETFHEKFPEEEFSGDIELHMAWGISGDIAELYYQKQYTPCFWAKLGLLNAMHNVISNFFSDINISSDEIDQCVRALFKHINYISRMRLLEVKTFYKKMDKIFFAEHAIEHIHYSKSASIIKNTLNANHQEAIKVLRDVLGEKTIEEVSVLQREF